MKLGMTLGSEPHKHGALALDRYVHPQAPAVPAELHCPPYPWGMLGNDTVACCVEAAMFHGDECFYLRRGLSPWPYQTPHCLRLYSAIAGYNPADPSTDQGTDPAQAMAWWRDSGLYWIAGHPGAHALAGYGSLPANSPHIRRAIWEFGTVIFCLGLPADWQSQIDSTGAHWRGASHGPQAEGHAVAGTGFTPQTLEFVSWGQSGDIDNPFAGAYLEQVLVPLSREILNSADISPSGFSFAQMRADLPPQS